MQFLIANTQGDDALLLAEGTYQPELDPNAFDPRERTFTIPDLPSVSIFGGYLGNVGGSVARGQPDGSTVRTVLSGASITGSGPCYHVLTAPLQQTAALFELNGASLVGGYANGDAASGQRDGAGAFVARQGLVWFNNVVFYGNICQPDTSFALPSGRGGGMFVVQGSGEVRVGQCTFRQNHAELGAGLFCEQCPHLYLGNGHFVLNGSVQVGGSPGFYTAFPQTIFGGGLYLSPQTIADVSNCLIYDNQAADAGAGIYWEPFANNNPGVWEHRMRHSTVTMNAVLGDLDPVTGAVGPTTARGAGLHCGPGGHLGVGSGVEKYFTIYNSVLFGNRVGADVTVEGRAAVASPPAPALSGVSVPWTFTDVGLGQGILVFAPGGVAPGAGAISVDPQFVNVGARNFRLGAASPCLDTASLGEIGVDIVDLDGDQSFNDPLPFDLDLVDRTQNSAGPGTGAPDMGAFEN